MSSPAGIGAQVTDPWRGWLQFESLPPDLQRAEDSTMAFDHEQQFCTVPTGRDVDCNWFRERPATDAERQLLAHLGYELPDELITRVIWRTSSLRWRRWPALETTTTEGDATQ